MGYTAERLLPVMAHIAKNVVKVNEGQTKQLVSALEAVLESLVCSGYFLFFFNYTVLSCRLLKASIPLQSKWRSPPFRSSSHWWWRTWQSKRSSGMTPIWHRVLTCTFCNLMGCEMSHASTPASEGAICNCHCSLVTTSDGWLPDPLQSFLTTAGPARHHFFFFLTEFHIVSCILIVTYSFKARIKFFKEHLTSFFLLNLMAHYLAKS